MEGLGVWFSLWFRAQHPQGRGRGEGAGLDVSCPRVPRRVAWWREVVWVGWL